MHPYHDIHRQSVTQGPDDVNQVLLLCVAIGGIFGEVHQERRQIYSSMRTVDIQ